MRHSHKKYEKKEKEKLWMSSNGVEIQTLILVGTCAWTNLLVEIVPGEDYLPPSHLLTTQQLFQRWLDQKLTEAMQQKIHK